MISKEKFCIYLDIQKSGLTNMYDVIKVSQLSNYELDTFEIRDIMRNYSMYKKEYFGE